jgi:hypothetical protein
MDKTASRNRKNSTWYVQQLACEREVAAIPEGSKLIKMVGPAMQAIAMPFIKETQSAELTTLFSVWIFNYFQELLCILCYKMYTDIYNHN